MSQPEQHPSERQSFSRKIAFVTKNNFSEIKSSHTKTHPTWLFVLRNDVPFRPTLHFNSVREMTNIYILLIWVCEEPAAHHLISFIINNFSAVLSSALFMGSSLLLQCRRILFNFRYRENVKHSSLRTKRVFVLIAQQCPNDKSKTETEFIVAIYCNSCDIRQTAERRILINIDELAKHWCQSTRRNPFCESIKILRSQLSMLLRLHASSNFDGGPRLAASPVNLFSLRN